MLQIVGAIGTLVCVIIFALQPSFPTPDKLLVFMTFVAMLISTAQFLTEQMRQDDGIVYRWGGDEFCIILAPSSEDDERRNKHLPLNDQAIAVKERLTEAYQKSFAIWAYNNNYEGVEPLGLNIDYSVWEPGMASAELITKADPKHNPYQ